MPNNDKIRQNAEKYSNLTPKNRLKYDRHKSFQTESFWIALFSAVCIGLVVDSAGNMHNWYLFALALCLFPTSLFSFFKRKQAMDEILNQR